MKRHLRHRLDLAVLASLLTVAGCDYSSPPSATSPTAVLPSPAGAPSSESSPKTSVSTSTAPPSGVGLADEPVQGKAILENVIHLLETASLKPGGDNFGIAIKNLNQYFENRSKPADYKVPPEARKYLLTQLPEPALRLIESPTWTLRDARHLEDCMLYHKLASRVGGAGDDLTRVRRVFDWIVRNVQLVPAGALGSPGLDQAQARPYDVLMRGMGTEAGGVWSERGWTFLAFCRQLGVDAGMVTYTPTRIVRKDPKNPPTPVVWLCAVLIDKKAYLFDPRIGLPVPGPGGQGVATLDDALADPSVLDGLDLPGQSPYNTNRASLAASTSKIGIQIDSSLGYVSPRMKLLQQELAGKNRTILYRNPAELRDRFAEALGPRLGNVEFWELPILVDTLLFSDPKFVEATQRALSLFDSRYPLLYARMKQLQGDPAAAIQDYVALRYAENPLMMDKRTTIPSDVQQALDAYATYFLALAKLEQGDSEKAADFFRETLRLLPAPGPGRPYYCMFRWGAQANLGRLAEAQGEPRDAIAYYVQPDPTSQRHGNLVRARELVWLDPMSPPPNPLPPPPGSNILMPVAEGSNRRP